MNVDVGGLSDCDSVVDRGKMTHVEPLQNRGFQHHQKYEEWHRGLKNHLTHPHPNVYNLLKLLQNELAKNKIQLIQYAGGGKRVQRKRKYREIDSSLKQTRLQNYDTTGVHVAYSAS